MPNQIDVKKIFWILLNLVLVVLIVVAFVVMRVLLHQDASSPSGRTISVSATGEVIVSPDVAALSFAVTSEGEDPAEVADENNQIINRAIEFVKEQGLESGDIKTVGYNLYPRYEYDEKRRLSFITGYTLTQSVFVKIRNFDTIPDIIGGLPALGINQINSLRFEVDDPEEFLNQAREEAFGKAREKAETMARQNGVRISRVISFSESEGGFFPPPIPLRAEGLGGADFAVAAPTIEPGSEEVTVHVNVIYELK